MAKVFISHSSADKKRYTDKVVSILVDVLGEHCVEYDSLSFEAGNKSIDEINRAMNASDLFVVLLSDAALNSKWVQGELSKAEELINNGKFMRIYPLIIDTKIKYDDSRIPDWMVEDNYNLRYIKRPTKAAKLIIEKMKDISWSVHPEYKKTKNIFVGRNDLINDFEKRIDDYDKDNVTTIIASGLNKIGRKSLVKNCLRKASIISNYYDFPIINLKYSESIEDFIIKLNDLGFNDEKDLSNLLTKNVNEKIAIANSIISEIQETGEIVLIQDNGCLVNYSRKLSSWFKRIVSSLTNKNKITFVIISRFKCLYSDISELPCVFYTEVPELSKSECIGLLRRTLDANGIEISRQDIDSIRTIFTGYPLQVLYASEIIKNHGIKYLLDNTYLLSDFNSREMSSLLSEFEQDKRAYELLALIAKFGSISFEVLYELVDQSIYQKYINGFLSLSICEYEGVDKEYIRLNEAIKDYIDRTDAEISNATKDKIKKYATKILLQEDSYNLYTPQFYFSVKLNLLNNLNDNFNYSKYMIPSVYLKSMMDLYERGNSYELVVKLADKAIENETFTDKRMMCEIRYLLCAALAKQQSPRFLEEIKKVNGINHYFLKAFYYRQIGKNDVALNNLDKCDKIDPDFSKAKRERVLVLKNLQEFDLAMELSEENYRRHPKNPYHIHAYFDCLIKSNKAQYSAEILNELLDNLSKIKSKKAQSMHERCQALHYAFIEQNQDAAYKTIDLAIHDFPIDKKYAYVVKAEIADVFGDIQTMKEVVEKLKKERYNKNTVIIIESKIMARDGNIDKAIEYFNSHIKNFTSLAMESFREKLHRYADNRPAHASSHK